MQQIGSSMLGQAERQEVLEEAEDTFRANKSRGRNFKLEETLAPSGINGGHQCHQHRPLVSMAAAIADASVSNFKFFTVPFQQIVNIRGLSDGMNSIKMISVSISHHKHSSVSPITRYRT